MVTFSPGASVARAATLYTSLVQARRIRTPQPLPADNPQRLEAHELRCPDSPATSGPLSRHNFPRNEATCAFCNNTPAWILAAPTQENTP